MTGEIKDKESELLIGVTAIKPPGWDRKGLEALKFTIWNPDTGEVLTRTPLSWLCIIGFYLIYYSFLVGFWIACLQIFFLTLPEPAEGPRWMLDSSIIGTNPGVGVRPGPPDARIDSQMYFVKTTTTDRNPTTNEKGELGEGDKNIDNAVRLKKYVDTHYDLKKQNNLEECPENGLRAKSQAGCIFDMSVLDKCEEYPYGFVSAEEGSPIEPCLYIKFNKIWDWEPKAISNENLTQEAFQEMPEELKTIIRDSEDKQFIWIDCHGVKPADKDIFHVDYYPSNQGIPLKYFPFRGGNYQRPIVAMKFRRDNGKNPAGQLIHVECKAWFDGVKHQSKNKIGLVRFEIYFDDKKENPEVETAEETVPDIKEQN